jgi:rhamnogalacturonan endolyase
MRPRHRQRRASPGLGLAIERLESRQVLAIDAGVLPTPAAEALPARQVEYLTRGVNAISTGSSRAYINWRMLGTDPANIAFNVYRSTDGAAAVKRNSTPLTATTDFTDSSVTTTKSNAWFIRPVINGVEGAASESFTLPANAPVRQYRTVPLQIPPSGVTPTGETYTYAANDTSAADLDGDGDYELVVKWDPSNAKDNSQSGYTGHVFLDAYELDGTRLWRIDLGRNIRAGAHYTQFIAYDFDGDGRAEMGVKTAPGTIDGTGQPVLLGTAKVTDDYRTSAGYVLSGPEYLTVFDGLTGRALATANYQVPRGTVSAWGDSYGNRVDRFLAGVGYFDGQRPSLLMCRGYYTRTVLTAWDYRAGQLTQRWIFDTGNSTTGALAGYRGQGAHSLTIGDVDGDGRDEVTYGAMAVNDDGKPLYTTGLGHGDALHMSDMVPSRPGLEVYQVHESESAHQGKGGDLRDAATGALIAFVPGTGDVGRGCAFDIDPRYPGFEMWNSSDAGIYAADGTRIQDKVSNMFQNFGIWWDGDPLRELLDGTTISDWRISLTTNTGARSNYVFAPAGLSGNNGTKNTPCLTADLYGDWREEVVWRTSDNTALQIWSTTIASQIRLPTLMHDTQYRTAVAWQNVGYNQPPHTGYFIGQDMAIPAPPNVYAVKAAAAPVVSRPAAAAAVTASAAVPLTVLGSDDGGESSLRYAWTLHAGPGGVTFDANGSNAAKATVARFTEPGSHTLRVTITNAAGRIATSETTVVFTAAGDANADFTVDILDVATVVSAGRFDTGTSSSWADGDFNADGLVDILDVAAFVSSGLYDTGPLSRTSLAAAG